MNLLSTSLLAICSEPSRCHLIRSTPGPNTVANLIIFILEVKELRPREVS